MRKTLSILIASFLIYTSVFSQIVFAEFSSKQKVSLDFSINFDYNPASVGLTIDQSVFYKNAANGFSRRSSSDMYDCLRVIGTANISWQPKGLYEVIVYTDNFIFWRPLLNPTYSYAGIVYPYDYNEWLRGLQNADLPLNYGGLFYSGWTNRSTIRIKCVPLKCWVNNSAGKVKSLYDLNNDGLFNDYEVEKKAPYYNDDDNDANNNDSLTNNNDFFLNKRFDKIGIIKKTLKFLRIDKINNVDVSVYRFESIHWYGVYTPMRMEWAKNAYTNWIKIGPPYNTYSSQVLNLYVSGLGQDIVLDKAKELSGGVCPSGYKYSVDNRFYDLRETEEELNHPDPCYTVIPDKYAVTTDTENRFFGRFGSYKKVIASIRFGTYPFKTEFTLAMDLSDPNLLGHDKYEGVVYIDLVGN